VPVARIVRREILTGLLVGAALALAFLPVGLWRWDGNALAVAAALLIFAACATAGFIALSLPWFLNRLGIDPAIGSGPLATVIQDLLSVVIYLAIATAILK
jgi:magnesium transporter